MITLRNKTIEQFEFDTETASFDEIWTFDIDAGEDIAKLLNYMPVLNVSHPNPLLSGFIRKSCTIRKIPDPSGNGGQFTVRHEIPASDSVGQLEESQKPNLDTPPWTWPVQDYKVHGVNLEQALETIYDENDKSVPLETSAGTPIIASTNRPQATVSFGYNLQNFAETSIFQYLGKVNKAQQKIASVTYPKQCIMLQSASATPMIIKNEQGGIKWRYYRIDVSLLVDPKSFWRKYQNRSTFFRSAFEKGAAQIWTCTVDGKRYFGTLTQINEKYEGAKLSQDKESPQAVSEPMYLRGESSSGSAVEGEIKDWDPETLELISQKQEPTYVEGCPHESTDFAGMKFPTTKSGY